MTEEREVKARLEIEREGDVDAFKETASDVEQLGAKAVGVDAKLDALKERIAKLKAEAKASGQQVRDTGEAVESFGSKAVNVVANITAIAGAFTAGYAAGTKFRNVLNEISGGAFDQLIQKGLQYTPIALAMAAAQGSAGDAAQSHANNLNILRRQGIDPTGLSAQEAAAKVEELARAQFEAKEAAAAATAAHEKWKAQLGLSKGKLDELSAALVQQIQTFAAANQQLSQAQVTEIFKKQIQDLLDLYDRIGTEAESSLQGLANGWSLTTTAAEQAAARQKQIVEELRAAIVGAGEKTREDLEAQLAALPEILADLDLQELELVDPEQFASAAAKFKELVETLRSEGKQIPLILAEAAASTGTFVAAMEVAGGFASSIKPSLDAAADSIGNVGQKSETAAGQVGEQNAEVLALLAAWGKVPESVNQAASGVDTAADKLQAAGEKAGEGAAGLTEQAAAAGDAGQKLGQAAAETDSLSAAQDKAKASLDQTREGLNTLTADLDKLKGSFSGFGADVIAQFAAAQGFEQPILTGLDAIIAKAAQARAELQSVANVGSGGAGPVEPGVGGE